MIKDIEYEELGENIFPLQYLTEEEKKELGILEKKCCKNSKKWGNSCSNCSQNRNKEKQCGTCSKCSSCCRKK